MATRSFVEASHAPLGDRFGLATLTQAQADRAGFDAFAAEEPGAGASTRRFSASWTARRTPGPDAAHFWQGHHSQDSEVAAVHVDVDEEDDED